MNRKGKVTSHLIIKIHFALIHMYRNAKVVMTEYFRSEFIKLMSGTRRNIAQDILNRDIQYDVGE